MSIKSKTRLYEAFYQAGQLISLAGSLGTRVGKLSGVQDDQVAEAMKSVSSIIDAFFEARENPNSVTSIRKLEAANDLLRRLIGEVEIQLRSSPSQPLGKSAKPSMIFGR